MTIPGTFVMGPSPLCGCHNHKLPKAYWTPLSMAENLHIHVAQGVVDASREICNALICAYATHIASTSTQLDVMMRIMIRAKSVAMQQNGNTPWFIECTNISQMYFALCVIMINVLKVYSISVILALLEAHLTLFVMKRIQLHYCGLVMP